MSEEIRLDTKELDKLVKKLKTSLPSIKVGILGQKTERVNNEKTNAEIGLKHEFGIGVPVRSFLRMPLIENLDKELEKIDKKNIEPEDLPYTIGHVAQTIVKQAFDTGGFGQWKPSKKEEGKTLIDTGQLEQSISYEIG